MGTYEPRWSAEEQTMLDMMALKGVEVNADINKEYTIMHVYTPDSTYPLLFRADTEYEAIRKVFKFISDGKGSRYAQTI